MSNTLRKQKHYLSNTQKKTQATLRKISERPALISNTPQKRHRAVVFQAQTNTTQQTAQRLSLRKRNDTKNNKTQKNITSDSLQESNKNIHNQNKRYIS